MKRAPVFFYKKTLLSFLLLPLAFIYSYIIRIRHWLFQKNIFKSHRISVPVIVVGNITLGGTGKTPLVIALVKLLKNHGLKPGIVSRGYKAHTKKFPHEVTENSTAWDVGDEPLLLKLRTAVPVIIDPCRPKAAEYLLKHHQCNVIISDDGLQHYALQRDIEIIVIDAQRKFGNDFIFPAGPLRESKSRLRMGDFIIINAANELEYQALENELNFPAKTYQMNLIPNTIINLKTKKIIPVDFINNKELIAIAGIGNPDRFFYTLTQIGLTFQKQPMPDHYSFSCADFPSNTNINYIMTEKDALKCQPFATESMFYLPVTAEFSKNFERALLARLNII